MAIPSLDEVERMSLQEIDRLLRRHTHLKLADAQQLRDAVIDALSVLEKSDAPSAALIARVASTVQSRLETAVRMLVRREAQAEAMARFQAEVDKAAADRERGHVTIAAGDGEMRVYDPHGEFLEGQPVLTSMTTGEGRTSVRITLPQREGELDV